MSFPGDPPKPALAHLLRDGGATLKRWAIEAAKESPEWERAIDVVARTEGAFSQNTFKAGNLAWKLEIRNDSSGVTIAIPYAGIEGVKQKESSQALHKDFGRLLGSLLLGLERRAAKTGKPVPVTLRADFVVHPKLQERLRDLGFQESRIPDQLVLKAISKISYGIAVGIGVGSVVAGDPLSQPLLPAVGISSAAMAGGAARWLSDRFETGRNYSLRFEVNP